VITLAAMWFVVLTNLRGVKEAGIFAEVTTYAKLVPFAAISIIGLAFINLDHLSQFNPSGQSLMASSAALAPLTMFAFLGLESATVPAGDVVNPERTIPRSTMFGVLIAATLYILGTTVVLGVVPREDLVKSAAPFGDAAQLMWGPWAAGVVGVAVMISSLGALNGWTLLMGQVPMAAAQDGLFPALFGRVSARGVPAVGIVCSALLATALILIQGISASGFAAFYSLVVNLATMTAVVPYAFCALAVGLISARALGNGQLPRIGWIEVVAFVFSIFTLYGCGPEAVLYGFVLLMLGVPVYVWQRREHLQQPIAGLSRHGGQ
jgi:arginine:agmatine antiporter